MASPTYNSPSALSPPYPSSAALPQPPKRRQTDMPNAPGVKRRKASMLSTTSAASHPLRQTSFPPERSSQKNRFSRSPSVDTSVVSGSVAGTKKRKRKSQAATGAIDDGASTVGGAKSTDGRGMKRGGASREPSVDAEEEEEAGDEETAIHMVSRTKEEAKKEMDQRAMLVRSMDPRQFSRYEAFRASKFAESVAKRIINQTISQSAPQSVTLAIRTVSKIYASEIIGMAVKIQKEWIEAAGEKETPLDESQTQSDSPPKEARRGPLLPDHLREAVRRYRAEREGGLTGHLNLYHAQASSGVERFGVKFNGKRLLR